MKDLEEESGKIKLVPNTKDQNLSDRIKFTKKKLNRLNDLGGSVSLHLL